MSSNYYKTKSYKTKSYGNNRLQRIDVKQIVLITISVLLVAAIVGVCIVLFSPKIKTIPTRAFSRGSLSSLGTVVDSKKSIYTKNMFECQGLKVTVEDDATVDYVIYYYDSERNYLSKTDKLSDDYESDVMFAKYARVVIIPKGAETDVDNFKIGIFEVRKYAKMLDITVNKNQGATWSKAKLSSLYDNVTFLSCIHNGKYWIATTDSGKIMYSSNAKEWNTSLFSGLNGSSAVSLAYGEGKYVVIDNKQGILVSDGIHDGWMLKFSCSNLNAVMYGNETFVAVGDDGQIIVSEDAETWEKIEVPVMTDLHNVVYEGDYYVIAGSEGYIYYANDFSEFMYARVDEMDKVKALYYYDGIYLAGGSDGHIACSDKLAIWELADVMSKSSIEMVTDFADYDGKVFASVYTSSGTGELWMSDDNGFTWNVVLSLPERIYSVESRGETLVLGCSNGAIYYLE